jgi:hypothetical protein
MICNVLLIQERLLAHVLYLYIYSLNQEKIYSNIVIYLPLSYVRALYESSLSPLEYELDDGPAIEALLTAYPHSVTVSDLPHSSEEIEDKVSIAQSLYKEGFLVIMDVATRGEEEDSNGDDDNDDPF